MLSAQEKRLDPDPPPPDLAAGGGAVPEVRLVEDARRRPASRPKGREHVVTVASAVGFVVATVALQLAAGGGRIAGAGVIALLVVSYAALSRVEFELGSGVVLPTELVLVPMLFLVAPGEVPLLVASGFVLAGLPEVLRGRLHPMRVFVRLSYSWYAIGPALVFAVARPGPPSWSDWPVYVLALGAQFAFDGASSLLREWFALGVRPAVLVPLLARAYLVDLLLAPIGVLAATAAVTGGYGFLPVLSLGALLALLANDRRERIGETIELTGAFEDAATAARVDVLTGLANRLAWDEHLASLGSRAGSASIIVADLDNLKLANDTRGHAFGDALLRATARLLSEAAGTNGLAARLGGDEFGIVLSSGPEQCEALVGRLRAAVEARLTLEGFPLSLSVGAASSPPEPTLAAAFAAADGRMYEQKRWPRRARATP